jgi:4-carboxymuconolactone decarboxylase
MSAPRLDPLPPAALDADQRRLYDAVLASPRGQGPTRRFILRDDETLTGPFDAWLRSPELGTHLERAGMAFRTHTALSDAAREVAVLVVAQAWGADFEWWVHGLVARRAGVPEAAIDAIGHGKPPRLEAADVAAAYDVAAALVHRRAIDDATLERARGALGERALVEVVTLVGFYQLVSGVLTTFEPPPPSGDLQVVGPPSRAVPA